MNNVPPLKTSRGKPKPLLPPSMTFSASDSYPESESLIAAYDASLSMDVTSFAQPIRITTPFDSLAPLLFAK